MSQSADLTLMIPIDVRISSAHNQKKQAPKKKRFMGDPFSAMQVEDSDEEVESKISSIKVIARDYKEKEIQGRREYFDKMKSPLTIKSGASRAS